MRKTSPRITALIETARSHVGMRSRAMKVNPYGQSLGYDGQAWSGVFLEFVLREAGVHTEPSQISTVASLSEYVRRNRLYVNPKPGDIVYLSYSTDHIFAQPHVGLVTETEKWKTDRSFRAVFGQIASGLSKGPQEADGVYERTMYAADVLAFARPTYRDRPEPSGQPVPTVAAANVQPGKKNKSVLLVQQALHAAVGATGMTKGVFDARTQNSVSRYQRTIGYLQGNGLPDELTLRRLAVDTAFKYFKTT